MVGGGSTVFSSLLLAVVLLSNSCSVICADGETAVQENELVPSPTLLTIKEIHKVRRRDDPSGRQQNIRLVVDQHDPISGAETLTLTLQTFDNETIPYEAVQIPDPSATEFEFEGNFVDAKAISVEAKRNGSTLACGSVHADVEDPGSRVAWVGDPETPSLRVHPGGRAQVEVPGHPPCVRKDSGGPCYYFGHSDSPLEPPPPRCDDLGLIVFCDEVVAQAQQPESPTGLQLYNREVLRVPLSSSPNRTEVVVSIPENDTILSPDDYACRESYWHSCVQLVDVPESLDYLYIIVVDLDEEGYANVSSGVLFEVFKACVVRLSHDVYEVIPDPSNSPGNYTVFLNHYAVVSCGGDGALEDSGCRVYFDQVIHDRNFTLMKVGLPDMVIYPASNEDPLPSSKIYSITSLSESSTKMRVQIQSPRTVAKAEFILFEDYVATSSQEVEVYLFDSGYIVDVPACEGKCEFVILGYGVDGSLVETGEAYVKLEDLDVDVAEVGREADKANSSLRVETTGENDAIIEGVGKCKRYSSPCYFFQLARETVESATYCVNITTLPIYGLNRTWVFHCSDSVTPYSELPGHFSVSMVNNYKVVVSGSFPTNFTEVVVFDPDTPEEELSIGHTECSKVTETTTECMCMINRSDDESPLRVLVTALDSNGTVLSSVMMTYEYTYPKKTTPAWVIVVSVFGCLVVVAAAAAVFCRKEKR
ncbi:uncharacterized protein LOC125028175 [Penaeus chinensis]|uniref:uncharacterized protein LOC125028175 n=1 Tax=Penaeus chinensis TaxID=139456 RepID=UPI001FB70C61|nr:uncharacterized protein LOC125028175 [Penaeus chinensis]